MFAILRILPGDPLVAVFGMEGFIKLSAADRAGSMSQLGLSDPLWLQYLHWARDVVSGNLGHSFFRAESVGETIWRRGPLTAEIIIEAALGFLDVGIPPPTPTWGNMLADSLNAGLIPPWWLVLFLGAAITLTVLAFNLLGDGIRAILDPRLRGAV
ncbi:MAG TPA: hypothetical protein VHW66_19745 [Stellaceae bacterium]|nr:hypothetical protein [Stellaceae bacterium]